MIFQDLLNDTYIPELIDDLNVSLTAEINDIKINVDVNSDNITENAANIKILEDGTFFTVTNLDINFFSEGHSKRTLSTVCKT